MLGHKLTSTFAADPRMRVTGVTRRPLPATYRAPNVAYRNDVNVLQGADVLAPLLHDLAPDLVINAVGAVKQRNLASAVDETFTLNATLPHLLALLNPNPGGKVIHFSTDCVYVGDRGHYDETEPPDALDLYGRSKACGEIGYGRHLTLRTSIIGFELENHLGLVGWLFQQPRGSTLRGYTRAIFSGLPTITLAQTVHHVVRAFPDLTGVHHVASAPITKFDLLNRLNTTFDLGHTLVPDERVVIDRSLNDTPFRQHTQSPQPVWDDLIAELLRDYERGPYAAIYSDLRTSHHDTQTS